MFDKGTHNILAISTAIAFKAKRFVLTTLSVITELKIDFHERCIVVGRVSFILCLHDLVALLKIILKISKHKKVYFSSNVKLYLELTAPLNLKLCKKINPFLFS